MIRLTLFCKKAVMQSHDNSKHLQTTIGCFEKPNSTQDVVANLGYQLDTLRKRDFS